MWGVCSEGGYQVQQLALGGRCVEGHAMGEIEDKHFWFVEHDGLVFGSGWRHDASRS